MTFPAKEATIQLLAELALADAEIRDANFEKHMDMNAIAEHTLRKLRAKTGEQLKDENEETDNER